MYTKFYGNPIFFLIIFFVSFLISCNEDVTETENKSFNYSVYNQFKTINFRYGNSMNKSNTISSERQRLKNINNRFDTNLNFPDELTLLIDKNPSEIEDIVVSNGWLNEDDIYLIDEFVADLKETNFNNALENYEENALSLNLSSKEFNDKMLTANVLLSLNQEHPETFQNTSNNFSEFDWGCARAVVALSAASVALASCSTGVACGLAVTAWVLAYSNYLDNCKD